MALPPGLRERANELVKQAFEVLHAEYPKVPLLTLAVALDFYHGQRQWELIGRRISYEEQEKGREGR